MKKQESYYDDVEKRLIILEKEIMHLKMAMQYQS